MAKTPKKGLVKVLIALPPDLRTELELIRQQTGLTVSQQARTSLTLWVAKCRKVPAQSLFAKGFGGQLPSPDSPGPGQHGHHKPQYEDPGPEPSQSKDPAAWAKWSAKAGNAAIAKLAAGEWGDD